jgi:hypothetical protein
MKGYRLGTIDITGNEQNIQIQENIPKETYDLIEHHTLNVHHHIMHQELFYIFLMNFIDFDKYLENALNSFLQKKNFNLLDNNIPEVKYVSRNANRFLFNFLTSARTYLDHTETYLKRKYGVNSPEFIKFKEQTNVLYDSHFEYRFIYKLRNYAQHCAIPLNRITLEYQGTDLEGRKLSLTPIFDKNELLKNYSDWGLQVKADFDTQPDEMLAIKIMGVYYKCLETLNNLFITLEKPSLKISIEYLENFILENFANKKVTESTQCCIFYDFILKKPDSYEGATFSTYVYPKQMIQTVKNYR